MTSRSAEVFLPVFMTLSTSARAEIVNTESTADKLEPLWAPLFAGGIVFGLAVFAALKIWRTINDRQPQ